MMLKVVNAGESYIAPWCWKSDLTFLRWNCMLSALTTQQKHEPAFKYTLLSVEMFTGRLYNLQSKALWMLIVFLMYRSLCDDRVVTCAQRHKMAA